MKAKIKTILIACAIMFLAAQPFLAQAQIVDCGRRDQGPNGACEFSDLWEMVYRVVNYLIGMAGFVAIFFIVWGGVQMLLSGGNMTAVQEAKSTVWHAILGLILTLLAYLIVGYVAGLIFGGTSDPTRLFREFLS
jgi:hypothetical protein